KQSIQIAIRLDQVISSKLPDRNNITHEGYVIASRAKLAKLRAAARNTRPFRADNWERVAPSFGELVQRAESLPNTADKAFVLSLIGQSCIHDQGYGKRLLDK